MALRVVCRCLSQTLRPAVMITTRAAYNRIIQPSVPFYCRLPQLVSPLSRFRHSGSGENKHEDIKTKIVASISQNTSSVTVDSLLYHSTALHRVLDLMLELGFKESDITDVFLSSPELLNSKGDELEQAVRLLHSEGFSVRQMTLTLKRNPNITTAVERVLDLMRVLRDMETFPDSNLQEVLTTHCELLDAPGSVMEANYNTLMSVFRRSDIKRMLRRNPLVLLQSKEEVDAKVRYVYHTMGLDQNDMVWANLLCHDLDHIRTRHQFLHRAGGFEKPDKNGATKEPNPFLKDILGSTDEEFAKKIAGLTLAEYNVFKELLLLERELQYERFEEDMRNFDEDDDDEMENRGYQKERANKIRMKKKIID